MHLFILITTLWVTNISLLNNINIDKRNNGMDERFEILYDHDKEIIYSIQKNYYNIQLLKKLQSISSDEEKIEAIQNNDYNPSYNLYNIKSGGLMKDWDFDIYP